MDTDARQSGSAFGRMFNVLAAPGEVFAEIKEKPVAHSNWMVPGLVWSVVGIAVALLLFSQDWAMEDISKAQEKAMEEQVRTGKISQAQADQGAEFMKRFMPIIMKVVGTVGTLAFAFGSPFFWGFFIWLVGTKAFKADFEYMKAVEAAGLATVIYMLAAVIATLVSFAIGHLATISPAFFLKEFEFTNKAHFAMAAPNPFYLWFVCVIASATAALAGVSWGKAAAWIFGIWIATRALFIVLGLGQFVM